MISVRRRLIGEFDDICDIASDTWKLGSECKGLDKLFWVALALNPIIWVVYFTCKWTFSLVEYIRDRFPCRIDFGKSTVHVPAAWLVRRVTVQEAEEENSRYPNRRMIDGVPFGFLNDYCQQVCDYMEADDELWFYRSNDSEFYGYVVLRDSKPVAAIETSPD